MRRIHYAWVVAAVTWLTLLAAAGFRSTPGTLIVPLEHEFGWSRATISLAVSINLLLFGLFAPFALSRQRTLTFVPAGPALPYASRARRRPLNCQRASGGKKLR